DITQAKRSERELTAAKEEALAASKAKDDFLAALSHELRTPLSPVLLLATAAAEDPELPESLRQDFKMIGDNVALQARLIDDLLDFNRISRGKLALVRLSLDVHETVREAARAVQEDILAKSIRLTFALEARRSRLLGDPVRLMQVFWNGLKNAVKFTPTAGQIDVFSRLIEAENLIEIRIEDTGIGMNAEELARVFQPFIQGRHARERSSAYGGLGLGLSIARDLVEAHGGTIWAESAGPNQGASLFIRLPLADPAA
ncbi:MAG TPA: HAMP domain-containing sensor histidine kinase, partial [Opitutaceae bacterium]|nr:HAMP domain-containing sensor histidine kinase [Opitutaceae bacterium]